MRNGSRSLCLAASAIVIACSAVGPAYAKPGKPAPYPDREPVCETITTLHGSLVKSECAWTPVAGDGVGPGSVSVEATGAIAYLVIAVRDSAPGDYCYLQTWDEPSQTRIDASFDLARSNGSYWESPANWCGAREDLNGAPLTVTVSARVKRGTVVRITLDPAQGS